MKTIVVYKSKSGFSKKYASWIANELSADQELESYDTIIYGGGLYASGINGVKLITKNLHRLEDKRIVVFASGASPPRKDDLEKVENNNFTKEQQKKIHFFYLRGGFDYNKLTPIDKLLMKLLKWRLKTKATLTPDEKGMLALYNIPTDFTKRKNIEEIILLVNS